MQTRKSIKRALSVYFIILILIPLLGLYSKFNIIDLSYLICVAWCFLRVLLIIRSEEK